MNNIADIGVNTGVFLVTLVLAVLFFRKDGKWDAGRGKYAFRFFTCQSNVLCAAACLLTAVGAAGGGEIPVWIRISPFHTQDRAKEAANYSRKNPCNDRAGPAELLRKVRCQAGE